MSIYFCGVDVGYENGAICLLSPDFKEIIFQDITDKNPKGVHWHSPLISFFRRNKDFILSIAIEKVSTSPRQGVVSAGKFMYANGVLQALAELTDKSWHTVAPLKWQECTGVSINKEVLEVDDTPEERGKKRNRNKYALKTSSYEWAKAKFPNADLGKRNFNRSDALGIAYYLSQRPKAIR